MHKQVKKNFHNIFPEPCLIRLSNVLFGILLFITGCTKETINPVSPGPPPCGTLQVSYEGKTYNTVQMKGRCWLKENLDAGTMINSFGNSFNNGIIEKYCYDNDPANCAKYGGLYQWDEAMNYAKKEGARGICPDGWHIPSVGEMLEVYYIARESAKAIVASKDTANTDSTYNTSGFSALMTGIKKATEFFIMPGGQTYFWVSREADYRNAFALYVAYSGGVLLTSLGKEFGCSIRCVQD